MFEGVNNVASRVQPISHFFSYKMDSYHGKWIIFFPFFDLGQASNGL
jgi:hypothetical protein